MAMVAFYADSVIILDGPGLCVHVDIGHGNGRGWCLDIGYVNMRKTLDERLDEIVKESVEEVVRRAKEIIAASRFHVDISTFKTGSMSKRPRVTPHRRP